jgi:hypothetical protein
MLHIRLEKLETTGIKCAHISCKKDPKYHINIIGSVWYIKVDSPVAIISLGGKEEIYCRGCIDELYHMVKTKLDPKLWAFH